MPLHPRRQFLDLTADKLVHLMLCARHARIMDHLHTHTNPSRLPSTNKKNTTNLPIRDLDILESPVALVPVLQMAPVPKQTRLPRALDRLHAVDDARLALHARQRAARDAQRQRAVAYERARERDDGRGVAHEQHARGAAAAVAGEAPRDLGDEGGHEARGAVVHLLHVLARARGVPHGGPRVGVDLGEVGAQGGGVRGARVEPGARCDGGVPLGKAWYASGGVCVCVCVCQCTEAGAEQTGWG